MTITSKTVLIIGAGRMAQAIIEGIQNKKEFSIIVANSGNKSRLQLVKEHYGVETSDSWAEEAAKADIIILAMPPEAHEPILNDLAPLVKGQLVLTIAAGIKPAYLEEKLPAGTPVAWVMPNTAAKLGKSMTLYTLGKHVNGTQSEWIEMLISGIGEYEKVTEQQVIELTAVTGSAPAFIYRIAKALEEITLQSGVSKEQARKLVVQMIIGSAEMLKTNVDPEELVNQVATPGGSTAAGLKILDNNNLSQIIQDAIDACREKAKM